MPNRTLNEWIELSKLQEKVLDVLSNSNNGLFNNFVFAGGTVLTKYYLNHRNSEDLDFQCQHLSEEYFFVESKLYLKQLIDDLINENINLKKDFFDKNYHCLYLINEETKLKIENINYFDVMDGEPLELENGIKIDNLKNILSSKITTFCNRQQPKDLFDILTISLKYNFDWDDIFRVSTMKQLKGEDEFNGSINNFINSITSFDFDNLIEYLKSDFCKYHENDFTSNKQLLLTTQEMILDIKEKRWNSLAKTDLLLDEAIPFEQYKLKSKNINSIGE